jgi:hypothetical protein
VAHRLRREACGIFSQSSVFGVALLEAAGRRGVGCGAAHGAAGVLRGAAVAHPPRSFAGGGGCRGRGVLEHSSFGDIISFGLDGVATELLDDMAFRILPLTDVDAAELVRSVKAAPLLFGHRGAEPADVAALEDLLLRVSRLAEDLPQVAELELRPVIVGSSGVSVLHARAQISPPPVVTDLGPRRLG